MIKSGHKLSQIVQNLVTNMSWSLTLLSQVDANQLGTVFATIYTMMIKHDKKIEAGNKGSKRAGDIFLFGRGILIDNNQGVSNVGSEKHFSGLSLE